jgi:predicted nucleic acid-binding protein
MKTYHYWDTCTILGWLAEESDKLADCKAGIVQAEKGDLTIVTSAFTLAEVLHLKGGTPIPAADREKVNDFFENDYILLVDVDRTIAEAAQEVYWSHGVPPKDAIHVATALNALVPIVQLDTFDGPLIALSGQIGSPPLTIGRPTFPQELI